MSISFNTQLSVPELKECLDSSKKKFSGCTDAPSVALLYPNGRSFH